MATRMNCRSGLRPEQAQDDVSLHYQDATSIFLYPLFFVHYAFTFCYRSSIIESGYYGYNSKYFLATSETIHREYMSRHS